MMINDSNAPSVTGLGFGEDSVSRIGGLSNRTLNVLSLYRITSLYQLACFKADHLRTFRNAGAMTFQELARGLLKLEIRPQWLESLASSFHYELWSDGDQAKIDPLYETGWGVIAGPYDKSEQWMLEGVLADMERDDIEYVLCREVTGGIVVLRQGLTPVEPEGEQMP